MLGIIGSLLGGPLQTGEITKASSFKNQYNQYNETCRGKMAATSSQLVLHDISLVHNHLQTWA